MGTSAVLQTYLTAKLCSRFNYKYYQFSAGNLNAAMTTEKLKNMALVYEDVQFAKDKETLWPILTVTLILTLALTLTKYMSLHFSISPLFLALCLSKFSRQISLYIEPAVEVSIRVRPLNYPLTVWRTQSYCINWNVLLYKRALYIERRYTNHHIAMDLDKNYQRTIVIRLISAVCLAIPFIKSELVN